MGISIWHLLVILVVVFVLFGAGKLPRMMGDIGRGIRSLKQGLRSGEGEESAPVKLVAEEAETVKPAPRKKRKS